jgi:hypothetical protein
LLSPDPLVEGHVRAFEIVKLVADSKGVEVELVQPGS